MLNPDVHLCSVINHFFLPVDFFSKTFFPPRTVSRHFNYEHSDNYRWKLIENIE